MPRRFLLTLAVGLAAGVSLLAETWRGTGTANFTTSGTSITMTEPSGSASGDFMLAVMVTDASGSITKPGDWTQIGSTATGSAAKFATYYCVRTGSACTLTWTVSMSSGFEWDLVAVSLGGTPNIQDNQQTAVTNSGTTPDPPAATVSGTGDVIIAIGVSWAGSQTTWSAPANYTMRANNANNLATGIASRTGVSAGSENPGSFSVGTAADNIWGQTVIVNTGGGGATPTKKMLTLGVGEAPW